MNLFGQTLGRRYFHEIKLILSEKNPLPAIRRLAQFNLLNLLHRSLRLDKRLSQILEEAHRAIAWHKLLYLDDTCRQWIVYMLALTSRLQTRGLVVFCRKFEVPERYTQLLVREKVDAHRVIRTLERRVHLRPSEIYWLLKGFSHEGLLYVMAICRKKVGKQAVSSYVTHLRNIKTFIHGADLKKMGYPPGPKYQIMLNSLLEAKLDGLIHSREDEIRLLRTEYPLETA